MVSRFFGKSSKKSTPSMSDLDNSSSANSPNVTASEDEGFTLLNHTPTASPAPNNPAPAAPPIYPPLPNRNVTNNPYPYPTGTMASQASLTIPQMLEGVPFVLSAQCSIGLRLLKSWIGQSYSAITILKMLTSK